MRISSLLIIPCSALIAVAAGAERYVEITAEIEMFSIPRTNEYSFSVVCTTDGKHYRIDPSFRESGTTQWFFDGTNLYRNIVAIGGARPLGASIQPGESRPATTNSSVHIRESSHGFPGGGVRSLVPWLAFCSGTYLKQEGRHVPLPIVMNFSTTPDGFGYSDVTETFNDKLGLPQSIRLYASEATFAASLKLGFFGGNQDVDVWKRGNPRFKWDFPEGALRFTYDVIESTNFLGNNFPLKFEMVLYAHEDGEMRARSGSTGRVTSIRAAEKPHGVITPGAPNQNIVDWRFSEQIGSRNAIIYWTTNAHAAPKSDAALQEKVAEKLRQIQNRSPVRELDESEGSPD